MLMVVVYNVTIHEIHEYASTTIRIRIHLRFTTIYIILQYNLSALLIFLTIIFAASASSAMVRFGTSTNGQNGSCSGRLSMSIMYSFGPSVTNGCELIQVAYLHNRPRCIDILGGGGNVV